MSVWAQEAKQNFADSLTLQLAFLIEVEDQFITSGP